MTSRPSAAGLRGEIAVYDTGDQLAVAVADWLATASANAVAEHGSFSIALAGGSTPRALYRLLTSDDWRPRFAWEAWRVYFDDERACAPTDPASNYHMVREALLDHVAIDAKHVHRMRAESPDLDAAAAEYSSLLEATLPPDTSGAPRLDCTLLGLGTNGHTASLFPDTPALDVTDRWATRGRADYAPFDRITLTFPTLNVSARVAFLVTGEEKRAALQATAAGTVPAALVDPHNGTLRWFLDRAAAGDAPEAVRVNRG
jgi:6-phosphogluconolactonase